MECQPQQYRHSDLPPNGMTLWTIRKGTWKETGLELVLFLIFYYFIIHFFVFMLFITSHYLSYPLSRSLPFLFRPSPNLSLSLSLPPLSSLPNYYPSYLTALCNLHWFVWLLFTT